MIRYFVFGALVAVWYFILMMFGNEWMKAFKECEPKIVQVAVNEVPIPMTYNAKELNEYCEYEWQTLKKEGWLPDV